MYIVTCGVGTVYRCCVLADSFEGLVCRLSGAHIALYSMCQGLTEVTVDVDTAVMFCNMYEEEAVCSLAA